MTNEEWIKTLSKSKLNKVLDTKCKKCAHWLKPDKCNQEPCPKWMKEWLNAEHKRN